MKALASFEKNSVQCGIFSPIKSWYKAIGELREFVRLQTEKVNEVKRGCRGLKLVQSIRELCSYIGLEATHVKQLGEMSLKD